MEALLWAEVVIVLIGAALWLFGWGLAVILFTALPRPGEIFVLSYVSTRGARDFNRGELLARYREGRDFLLCA